VFVDMPGMDTMAERLRDMWDLLREDCAFLRDLAFLTGVRRGLLLGHLLFVAFAPGLIVGMGLAAWGR
jgi:hypothetical protein